MPSTGFPYHSNTRHSFHGVGGLSDLPCKDSRERTCSGLKPGRPVLGCTRAGISKDPRGLSGTGGPGRGWECQGLDQRLWGSRGGSSIIVSLLIFI